MALFFFIVIPCEYIICIRYFFSQRAKNSPDVTLKCQSILFNTRKGFFICVFLNNLSWFNEVKKFGTLDVDTLVISSKEVFFRDVS